MFSEQGWEIRIARCYGEVPTKQGIPVFARELAYEIRKTKPAGLIGHSMGADVIREAVESHLSRFFGPVIFLESPNKGMRLWQLLLLAYFFPPTRQCSRDMWAGSAFMRNLSEDPIGGPVLEIHGKFSTMLLSRNIFEKLPYTTSTTILDADHIKMVADPRVVKVELAFLNAHVGGLQ